MQSREIVAIIAYTRRKHFKKMDYVSLLFILTLVMRLFGTSALSIHEDLQSLGNRRLPNNSLNIETLIQQNKNKRVELDRAQKVNKSFEKLIQLVNILGQVDTFLSERTKSLIRKLALLAEDDEGYYYRRRRS